MRGTTSPRDASIEAAINGRSDCPRAVETEQQKDKRRRLELQYQTEIRGREVNIYYRMCSRTLPLGPPCGSAPLFVPFFPARVREEEASHIPRF